jgi:hypothetical protein
MDLEKVLYILCLIVLRHVSYCHELESIVRDPSSLSSIQKLHFVLNRQKHDRQEKFLMNSPPPKPEVILTNFFAEPIVLLVPITSRDKPTCNYIV